MLKSADQIVKAGGLPGTAWNVFSGGMAGAGALGALDTALDGRDQREGDPSAMMQASDSAGWLTTTPALMNRLGAQGSYRRGATGLMSLPSSVGGAYQGLTSGNLVDTGLGALDATMAYQGGKEVYDTGKHFLKSPLGQRSVNFLNDVAKPAANMTYDAAKPVVTNAIKATPGAITGAYNNAINYGSKILEKPVLKSSLRYGGKATGFLGKKVPLLGLGIGLGLGADRLYGGDVLGAGAEVLSGAAATIPGPGTAASAAIDAGLMARDKYNSEPQHAAGTTAGSLTGKGTITGTPLPNTTAKLQPLHSTPSPVKPNYPTTNSLSFTPKINIGNPSGQPATKTPEITPVTNIAKNNITPAAAKPTQPAVAKPTQPAVAKPTQPAVAKPTQPAVAKPIASNNNPVAVAASSPEPIEKPQNFIPLEPKSEAIAPQQEQIAPQQNPNFEQIKRDSRVNRVVAGPTGKAVAVGGSTGIIDKMKAEGRIPQDFQLTPGMRVGEEALPPEIQAAKKEYMAGLTPNISAPSEPLTAARSHYNSLKKPSLTGVHPGTGQPMARNSAENRALSEWSTEKTNARQALTRLENEDKVLRARENAAIELANKAVQSAPKMIATTPAESAPILKQSVFRRNTGILENGEVWINPKDRIEIEKLGFAWEDYIMLPPGKNPEIPTEYFKDLV
jgi:hypothetical protein